MTRITNRGELKDHLTEQHTSFVITQRGGTVVSRIAIRPLSEGRVEVFDGTRGYVVELDEHELLAETGIGDAMERGNFLCER